MGAMLLNMRGSLWRYPIKFLLLGNEMDLRRRLLLLGLHLVAHHLLLLLRSESILHWLICGLEGIRAHWCHEIETLILVARGHRQTL